jgi:LCP family protein required for cell wall assembly
LRFLGLMRTTLKKGIGRGAELNGNGHAVLPPGVLTQMTRYRQPKRSALRFVGKILFSLVAAALMVALALAGGYYLYLDESVEKLNVTSPEVKKAQKELAQVPPPDQPATALVIGYDRRLEDLKTGYPSRSDTLMLVRADPTTDTISMLSFPRDLHVEIHCPGKPTFGDRINQAYATCGPQGSLETVKQLTGVDVNYLIMVNFRGFKQMVANVGGVWIDVDRRYFNDNTDGGENYAAIDVQPGYQKLNGQKALDFARYRHADNDLYRNARQQMFVRAFKEQLTHSFLPTSVPKIIDAITENVQIAAGGNSKISSDTILRYAVFGYQLPPGHFFQSRIEELGDYTGPQGSLELAASDSAIQRAVQEFLAPDVDAAEKATAVALGRKLRKRTSGPPPSRVTLVALNGNGVNGSAANASYLLAQRGYQALLPPNNVKPNAPTYNYFRTKVYYRPKRPGAQAAAQKVAALVGSADVERMPAGRVSRLVGEAMLGVVVGKTFHGTLSPAPIDRTPKKRQPPAVIKDPATSLPLVRSVRKKADFPLMLPTVLERSSSPDPVMPVRAYETDGHETIRFTYRFFADGVYQYWGIQQTDWEDAPVLKEANKITTIRGRKYELHYSGAKLHMVVLREKGATYWVVNTLLDKLSNETMIAIAKGLRPLK